MMDALSPPDALTLERALAAPLPAIAYQLGRVIAEHARGRAVLEVDDGGFDLEEAECVVEPMPGMHQEIPVSWAGRGALERERKIVWMCVRWQEHALEVVSVKWQAQYITHQYHWVIGADAGVVEAFVTAVLDAGHVPARRILVYSGSCWGRDTQLYEAVQLATWEELVLPGDLAQRIRDDVVSFVGARELYARYGVPYKRGVLLTGPPGNGKTHCVRALIKEARLPTLYVRSIESRYGEVDANIQSVFAHARRLAPCLLVLEDLETLVKPKNLSVFLNELDGIRADTGILTLATSNRPERLDPALIDRPSRFDRKFHFDLPGLEERRRFLALWMARMDAEMSVDASVVTRLAERSESFSYAYLKELVVSSMVRWMGAPSERDMGTILDAELTHLKQHMARTREA
jgi:ATPase family protein associated with various cellular activities (AAA)